MSTEPKLAPADLDKLAQEVAKRSKADKRAFVFDCETGPEPFESIEHLKPRFSAPKNYTKPEAIAKYIEERDAEWMSSEKHALDPMTGRVLAVGIWDCHDSKMHVIEGDEKVILEKFWAFWEAWKHSRWIGFGIKTFDVGFLRWRSFKHSVKVPMEILSFRKPWDLDAYFEDLLDPLSDFRQGNVRHSLDNVAKTLLGVGKNGSGAEFADLYLADYKQAIAYLESDLKLTLGVAERMGLV